MLTYFHKMKNKSGVTFVELVVVISIIGILVAVGVPSYIASQRRAEASRHYDQARGFYFAVQNALLNTMEYDNTEQEFSLELPTSPPTTPPSTVLAKRITSSPNPAIVDNPTDNVFYIYAQFGGNGKIVSADLGHGPGEWNAANLATFGGGGASTTPAHNNTALSKLISEINNYSAFNTQEGHYYAMIDSEFRVIMAYYSKFADRAVLLSTPLDLDNRPTTNAERDYAIGNRIYGAFPRDYSLTRGGAWFVEIPDKDLIINNKYN